MIGTQLLHYQIEAHLGSGGMGDVYRARDTRLGRTVAIKVLPEAVASDPERVARFEREARLLASLNHPHIAALYGMEPHGTRPFLVMELVEGDTLAQRIARGPMPVDEALGMAHQIVEALEAAHEKGVIHRDLKPANVKVTPDGTVKVLDFGLAKAMDAGSGYEGNVALTNSPTLSLMATQMGVVLGTAAYMAPEQAKGGTTDQRSDLFSFGCVLYEMLTGRQSFQGDTVAEIMAAVLKSDADLTLLSPGLNPRITELLRRCLAKDPKRRWHAAADVRMEIEAIQADPRGITARTEQAPVRQPLWKRAIAMTAVALVATAVSAAVAWNLRPAAPTPVVTRFTIPIPEGQQLTRTGRHNIAVSPDGQAIVYVANNQLYLRRMDDLDARPIPGTIQDVNTPFFSPDGRWIAFYAVPEATLKKIATTGGAPVAIASVSNPFGAVWTSEDQIILGQGEQGIVRVPANGGAPETIVTVEPGELAHGPQILPDGDHVLFTLAKGFEESRWDQARIVAQSLRTGARTVIINGGSDARYLPTGHLVYALGTDLMAVPFDERSSTVAGGPVTVVEGIARSLAVNSAAMFVSASPSGTMAYLGGDLVQGLGTRGLTLVDRQGMSAPLPMPPAVYGDPRVSPDGTQLAVTRSGQDGTQIWIHGLVGAQAPRRLTFDGVNYAAAWTPDGRRVVFMSSRGGEADAIYWQAADGSSPAERLTDPRMTQPAGPRPTRDGTRIVFRDVRAGGIWMLPLAGERKPQPVIGGAGVITEAMLSPDGRWLVYRSNESGLPGIYVQPFPTTGAKYQVATSAHDPIWSSDGRQIFYLEDLPNGDHRMTAVAVDTRSGFAPGTAAGIFDGALDPAGEWAYDVTPDSQRFVVMRSASGAGDGAAARAEITVTLNWFDELRQRVPRER
jgi:serine/threonine-protein kinase